MRIDTCPHCRHKVTFTEAPAPNGYRSQLVCPHPLTTSKVQARVDAFRCPNHDCLRVSVWMGVCTSDGADNYQLLSPRVPARVLSVAVPPHLPRPTARRRWSRQTATSPAPSWRGGASR